MRLHLILLLPSAITAQCLFSIDQLIFEESQITDFSVTRSYTFCPDRSYQMGVFDYSNVLVADSGSPPIPLRPNLHIRCGDDGNRDNNCVVMGGDLQVDGTNFYGLPAELDLNSVVVEGFTFVGTTKYSVYAAKKGDITFVDCEWRDITEAYAPLYFDFFNAKDRTESLQVDFVGCAFNDITYYGDGAYPAILVGNGDQNLLKLDRCDFSGNDFIFNNTQYLRNSYLVETSGPLTLSLSCFTNNSVGVSPVATYGSSMVVSDNNYGLAEATQKCRYLSKFSTQAQFDLFTPTCLDFESTTQCLSDTTAMPSASPTGFPSTGTPTLLGSQMPTGTPTAKPSAQPTISPPPTASPQPSDLVPSAPPSQSPTDMPSAKLTTEMEGNNSGAGTSGSRLLVVGFAGILMAIWVQ